MEKESLSDIWNNASNENLIHIEKNKFSSEINSRINKLGNAILARNNREIIVAIIIIPFMLYKGYYAPNLISQIGAFLVIPSLLLIIYKLKKGQSLNKHDLTQSFKEFMTHSKMVLTQEKQLLSTVIYWYILPGYVSFNIYFIGKFSDWEKTILVISVLTIFNAFIYYLNIRAVKTQIDPVIKQINLSLDELNDD